MNARAAPPLARSSSQRAERFALPREQLFAALVIYTMLFQIGHVVLNAVSLKQGLFFPLPPDGGAMCALMAILCVRTWRTRRHRALVRPRQRNRHAARQRPEPRPALLSQGEYGSRAGLLRVLAMLDRHYIPASFFVPGVSALLHQARCLPPASQPASSSC